LVAALRLGRHLAVVSDPRTREALGHRVARRLREIARVDEVVLEAPRADLASAEEVASRTRGAEALIAVGSGTINDLCKQASFATGRPYAVFATAPSMNGYLSGTASLARDGFKVSLGARCPVGVFLDLEVLAAAPPRLIRAGIGDVLCRTTAQADWLLAHLLLGTPYRETPFALQAEDEGPLLAATAAAVAGEPEAILRLVRLLVLSGLGMLLAGSSHPASMAEHLISHTLEMLHPELDALHGEQVGVATLTVSRLQHAILLAAEPPRIGPTTVDEAALSRVFGGALGRQCAAELRAKALGREAAAALARRLEEHWPRLRERLAAVMLPTATLEAALSAAGAPQTAEDLGLDPTSYRRAVRLARAVRNRFTILDLAADAGVLDRLLPDGAFD
jgi:glycerol-1-phosphate dehydrogenase [NAD(P)+]